MMKIQKTLVSSLALLGIAACSSSPVVLTPAQPVSPSGAVKYTQIERLSRPAIKEVFESFQHHQISNAVEPYNDPTIAADIVTTEDTVRPPNTTAGTDYGKTLASVLYPDEYAVNLNGTSPTSGNNDPEFFLSYEVDGPSYFGGRAPNDDVVDLELPVLFSNTLFKLGVVKTDDGEENNCLSAMNIPTHDPAKLTGTTFPYLAAAR